MRPLFIEWQRFASSSLGLLMLKHLDENERRWRSIADEQIGHSTTQQACDSRKKVTCASIEVKTVCSASETSLPVSLHKKLDNACDTSSAERVDCSAECAADCDGSVVCCSRVESRRGSLPMCDTVPLISSGPRRNSAPALQSAAVTVKKYLLATLAEHSSSFCTGNGSSESEHLFPSYNHVWCASEAAGCKYGKQLSDVGCVMEPDDVLCHRAPCAKKQAWAAVAPLNTDTTRVSIEGRPRDRRSNSHALVFHQSLIAGWIPGRRFSSPAVGQDHWTSRESESVPLLSPVIPSTTVCSHSALVNWFVPGVQ